MSQSPQPTASVFAGLDVGKAACQLAILFPDGSVLQRPVPTTPDGFAEMVALCKQHKVTLVVMEYTGKLELAPAAELWDHQIPLALINPRQSHGFAASLNRQAKTDRLDAELLALYGKALTPKPTAEISQFQRELREFAARRRQLTGMLVREKNRLGQTAGKKLQKLIQASVAFIEKQIEQIDREIHENIEKDPQLLHSVRQLESVPGISAVSATQLIVALPELGAMTRRTVASLAGLAPFARDSGAASGQRSIRGGRAAARTALYMPMLSAIRYNPIIKDMYQRLRAAGKRPKVAIVACMRKLLVVLNRMLKKGLTWNEFIKMSPN